MSKCVTLKCNQAVMNADQRAKEFFTGWIGITMYDDICVKCFNLLKEMDN